MPSFDRTTYEQIGQEAVDSLRSDRNDLDNQMCTVVTVDAISGKLPYLPTSATLGRDRGAQAIGSDPNIRTMGNTSVAYDLEQYSNGVSLNESQIVDLDQYFNIISEVAATILEDNATARLNDLAAYITNSSNVGQHAAGNGNWSANTSTPVVDIQDARYNDAPRADSVIMSELTALELQRHEDITAMAGFGYASGGAVTRPVLRSLVAELAAVQASNVYICDAIYNSAGGGQDASLAYVQSEFFGLYNKAGLLKIQQRNGASAVTMEQSHRNYEWAVTDVCCYRTVNDLRITEITGI